jgi:ABC-type branched-subunit amino acid transport system permease subunit
MSRDPASRRPPPALAGLLLAAPLVFAFVGAESERAVALTLAAAVALVLAASRLGLLAPVARAALAHERITGLGVALLVAGLAAAFHDDHFALLLLAKVLLAAAACLGLHIQMGLAGVPNFAGAAFFGVGGYTAAVLMRHPGIPHLLVLAAGGAAAALIGSLLLLPLLRTRGHYAALITIAFVLLFRTFLEVNDSLGGPQGLRVPGLAVLGFRFNDNREILGREVSFYAGYLAASFLLAAVAFGLARRIERSWIGLGLDAVRLDETASACFGIDVARWKIGAFTLGNALVGVAGALSAMMVGFIAPNNFTFRESLVQISIVLLGGIGNAWGLLVATFVVTLLPEKLQILQEYRYLLFAVLVMLVLRFRPAGLVPRALRHGFGSEA